MKYTVEQLTEPRESFGSYRYKIFKGGEEFAIFWHNYRGECEKIMVFSTGHEEDPPFGMCSDFLTGGGPLPLGLSQGAIKYLESLR
jgi:hypothetical protein